MHPSGGCACCGFALLTGRPSDRKPPTSFVSGCHQLDKGGTHTVSEKQTCTLGLNFVRAQRLRQILICHSACACILLTFFFWGGVATSGFCRLREINGKMRVPPLFEHSQ